MLVEPIIMVQSEETDVIENKGRGLCGEGTVPSRNSTRDGSKKVDSTALHTGKAAAFDHCDYPSCFTNPHQLSGWGRGGGCSLEAKLSVKTDRGFPSPTNLDLIAAPPLTRMAVCPPSICFQNLQNEMMTSST
jgi:hypothetical protein